MQSGETRELRRILGDYLARVRQVVYSPDAGPDLRLAEMQSFTLILDSFPRHVLRDLIVEELDSEHTCNRLQAAFMLVSVFQVDAEIGRAYKIIEESLSASDCILRKIALYGLRSLKEVPEAVYEPIQAMLHQGGEIAFMTAMTAISVAHLRQAASLVLLRSLEGDELVTQFEAAVALIRHGLQTSRAWATLDRFSKTLPREEFFESLVMSFDRVNPDSLTADRLQSIASDDKLKIATRSSAARVVGMAAPDSVSAQQFLLSLISSDNWQMIYSATEGIGLQSLSFPQCAMDSLVGKLSNSDPQVREAAAISLHRCCPTLNAQQSGVVAERLLIERDFEILTMLFELCMSAEEVALDAVVDALSRASHMRQLFIFIALTQMGDKAIAQLVRIFASNIDVELKRFLSIIIAGLQIGDRQTLLELMQLIMSADNEKSNMALRMLVNAGDAAAFLTPDLLELVLGNDQYKSSLASLVIENIGPKALPYFSAFEEVEVANRLDTLREIIEAQGHLTKQHDLSWFEDLNDLQVFVLLAEEIESLNGASFADVSLRLEEKQANKLISIELGVSKSNLGRVAKIVQHAIAERWGVTAPLLESRKKKWYVTVAGRRFYRKAKRFLSHIR